MISDELKRARQTFEVRPLPSSSVQPIVTMVNSPMAVFGPFPEGVGITIMIDVDCRVRAAASSVPPTTAAFGATCPKFVAGVHDFTMPKACNWVLISTVTQPPPQVHEIACWPADVGPFEDAC